MINGLANAPVLALQGAPLGLHVDLLLSDVAMRVEFWMPSTQRASLFSNREKDGEDDCSLPLCANTRVRKRDVWTERNLVGQTVEHHTSAPARISYGSHQQYNNFHRKPQGAREEVFCDGGDQRLGSAEELHTIIL